MTAGYLLDAGGIGPANDTHSGDVGPGFHRIAGPSDRELARNQPLMKRRSPMIRGGIAIRDGLDPAKNQLGVGLGE